LIVFFKNTLTIPKIKDLVNSPIKKYEDMFDVIHSSKNTNDNSIKKMDVETVSSPNYSLDDLIPKNENTQNDFTASSGQLKSMKDELKTFLKTQMNNSNKNEDSLSSYNNEESNYSFY
jgi:hypothetical protein